MNCYKIKVHTTNTLGGVFYLPNRDEYLPCENGEFYIICDYNEIGEIIKILAFEGVLRSVEVVGVALGYGDFKGEDET